MEITADQIIDYRKKNNLTQKELALMLCTSLRTINNYESGKKIPQSKKHKLEELIKKEKNYPNDISKTLEKFKDINASDIIIWLKHNKYELSNSPEWQFYFKKEILREIERALLSTNDQNSY